MLDSSPKVSYGLSMELSLSEQQQASLQHLSTQTGRSTGDLVAEAVDRMLAQERWFDAQVQIGLDQIARGEFLEEKEMDARFAALLRR
jgi:predicted transcriptional regulator